MVHHRIFKVLIFYHRMCICNVFFFFQVKIKEEEEEEEPAKKVRLRVYKLCIIFSYKKSRDILISLCGQESSIIEQCLATKCKVHRNYLVFS